MKILQIGLFLSLLFLTQSIFLAEDVCEPHLSIENQRAKTISKEAQAILVKVMKDKISLLWPVEVCKCWISSLFGPRASGFHNGVDFAALQGTSVFAAADGVVEVAQKSLDKNGYGNMILLQHKDLIFKDEHGYTMNYKTRYAHLHTIEKHVKEGSIVHQGQKIGTVGATGHVIAKHAKADPSHLHFEVYRGAKRINPLIALFATDYAWVKQNL
ncbi:MAG: M23 family metallopeptidase [Candidatus Chromulinivorax sp.]|nr:M23 family metallopeptidase [Candidatus Chromulinivorax sp.]